MNAATASRAETPAERLAWRVSPWAVAVAIALVAIAVRSIGLQLRPLWLDEAYTAWFSSRGWRELWTVVPTYETHPPSCYSLTKLWRGLFGADPVSLPALSVLLGILTVPVVGAVVREQERQAPTGRALLRTGMAAFLCACSPLLVFLDQEARPYPLMVFAYSIAVLGTVKLLREFAAGDPGRISSWAILAGGTELTLWSHSLGLLYAACLAIAIAPVWLRGPLNGARIRRGAATAAMVSLAYVPCLLLILERVADWNEGWLGSSSTMPFELFQLYSVPMEVFTVGSAIAVIVMLLLAMRAIGAVLRGRGCPSDRALVVLWLGPPIFAILISSLWTPIFLMRTLGATLVPAYLAMAGALARTPSQRERLVLNVAPLLPMVPTALQVALKPAPERWNDVSNYLASNVRPGDEVWLYPNDSALPLRAAGPGATYPMRGIPGDYPALGFKGPIRAGSPAVVSLTHDQAASVADHAPRTGTIWLVSRQPAIFDPQGDLPEALSRIRIPGKSEEWGYISVRPYYRR